MYTFSYTTIFSYIVCMHSRFNVGCILSRVIIIMNDHLLQVGNNCTGIIHFDFALLQLIMVLLAFTANIEMPV